MSSSFRYCSPNGDRRTATGSPFSQGRYKGVPLSGRFFSGADSEKTKSVQPFRELHVNSTGLCVAQQIDQLHRTRAGGHDLWVWDFVVDNPFGPVRRMIHHKDMAALKRCVLDVPPVENEA